MPPARPHQQTTGHRRRTDWNRTLRGHPSVADRASRWHHILRTHDCRAIDRRSAPQSLRRLRHWHGRDPARPRNSARPMSRGETAQHAAARKGEQKCPSPHEDLSDLRRHDGSLTDREAASSYSSRRATVVPAGTTRSLSTTISARRADSDVRSPARGSRGSSASATRTVSRFSCSSRDHSSSVS